MKKLGSLLAGGSLRIRPRAGRMQIIEAKVGPEGVAEARGPYQAEIHLHPTAPVVGFVGVAQQCSEASMTVEPVL